MDLTRFGVLGAGRMGRVHAANLARHVEGARVVAWADPTEPEMARLTRDLDIERFAHDWREVVGADDIDGIVIATPTDTHYEIVMAALERRLAVFCEKPLDLRLSRLREIHAAANRQRVPLMVAFQRRFDPAFAALERDIAAGRIGTAYTLRLVSRDSRLPREAFIPQSGGIFMDMSVHDFDMARFLLHEEIEEVSAAAGVLVDPMFARYGDFDSALTTVRFASGALAVVENGRHATYGYDQRIEVFGSGGMLRVENPPSALVREGGGEPPFFAERYADAYRIEMQAFVDALRAGAPPPVGVVESIRAVEASLAARRSVAERRAVRIAEIRQEV